MVTALTTQGAWKDSIVNEGIKWEALSSSQPPSFSSVFTILLLYYSTANLACFRKHPLELEKQERQSGRYNAPSFLGPQTGQPGFLSGLKLPHPLPHTHSNWAP